MGLLKRMMGNDKEEAAQAATDSAKPASVEPRHLTDVEFDEVLQGGQPVVVDFWAEWCGPCHMIAPAVSALAAEYSGRLLVAKVNADEYPEIIARYGIMGIPTLIFFKGGQEVDRVIGFTQLGVLKARAEKVLA